MLEAIPKSQSSEYMLLQVVISFPLKADFGAQPGQAGRTLKDDNYPLATLSTSALTSAFATYPDGTSIVSDLKEQLKRGEDESNR